MSDQVSGDSGSAAPAVSAPASPAGTSVPSGSSAAAPIAPPDGDGSTPTEPAGPIPFERHKAILEKARKEYEERYAWAKEYDPKEVQTWKERMTLMRDPHRFHKAWSDWYAQTYGGSAPAQGAKAPEPDPEPAPDLVAENGQPVFSAPQLRKWNEWNQKQLDARLQAMVAPLQERIQREDATQEAMVQTRAVLGEAQTWPGFNELRASISQRMKADKRLSLHGAYQRAYQEEYLPTERKRVREELLAEMNQKAHATTASPNTTTVQATPLREKSWEDVLKHFAK